GQNGPVRVLLLRMVFGQAAAIAAQSDGHEGDSAGCRVGLADRCWGLSSSSSAGSGPKSKETMIKRAFSVVALGVSAWLVAALPPAMPMPAFAQSGPPTPSAEQPPAQNTETANKEAQKPDEYAEAHKAIAGPAGNPECVWLGRRVVSLLWRDDLDTAFRHLDLYDRFGCPSGHIQAAFRCLVLHSNTIDPKAPDPKSADTLNGRVHACWINPALQPTPAPAAAAPSPTTNR